MDPTGHKYVTKYNGIARIKAWEDDIGYKYDGSKLRKYYIHEDGTTNFADEHHYKSYGSAVKAIIKTAKDYFNYNKKYTIEQNFQAGAIDNIIENYAGINESLLDITYNPKKTLPALLLNLSDAGKIGESFVNNVVGQFDKEVLHGNIGTASHYFGGVTSDIATDILISKGISKLAKSGQSLKYIDDIDDTYNYSKYIDNAPSYGKEYASNQLDAYIEGAEQNIKGGLDTLSTPNSKVLRQNMIDAALACLIIQMRHII